VVLLVFVAVTAVTAVAIWLAGRGSHAGVHRLINATLHTSGQFAVRLVVLVLAVLAGLSLLLGLDMLLGEFAGVLMRLVLRNAQPTDEKLVQSKLEGARFGFLVPIFFVHTGKTFDLQALVGTVGRFRPAALQRRTGPHHNDVARRGFRHERSLDHADGSTEPR
jgi:Kef-type K+ transport system membrane component KefB